MKHSLAALLLFACTSCGPSQPPAEEPEPMGYEEGAPTEETGEEATDAPPAEAADAKWADMSDSQKMEYMQQTVLPKMKASFAAIDPKFEDMKCPTCHGEGAKKGQFEMPSADLPKLTTTGKFEAELKAHPEMTKFMMEKVVPEMAALLHAEPYDATTQQGFGCFGCHMQKK